MHRITGALLGVLLTFVVALSGCAKKEPPNPLTGWLAGSNLNARETQEELYAAALKENTLVVYSTSTRMMDVAKSFQKRYPGLTVRVEHLREGEMIDKLKANYEAGNFSCDVILTADGQGIMQNRFLPENIVVKYAPYDIKDKILPGNNEDFLMLAGEAAVLTYNEKYYSRPPVSNLWELTEEKWRSMVYMSNPVRSTTTLAFLNMIIKNSDIMAKAYEEFYGKPLKLPDGETAGREFVRRLAQNKVNIVNSSDETAEEIGAPGSLSPSLGIVISSKLRLRDIGYEMVNHYGLEPFCGVYAPISVMLAAGAKNINAAKLYIRWILGEADGTGDGYKPYLQSGAWSVRSDVRDDTGIKSRDLNLLRLDKAYLYQNLETFLLFWEELMKNR